MLPKPSSHVTAILQALFVTLLWASSWVLIKFGLEDIPALTYAGLRYGLAFLCLLPFAVRSPDAATLRHLPRRTWLQLVILGVLFYAVTQGAQFLGLAYLPAVTVSLLLNFTTIVVAWMGIVLLAERPSGQQWGGIVVALIGVGIYFTPIVLPAGELFGILVVLVGVLSNAASSILGRDVNRAGRLSPLLVTTVSMGIGAVLLLLAGLLFEELPVLSARSWFYIAWLAIVNTAYAFTLWNQTLRTLQAMESSIINSTMLIHIAILAWLFLGERPTWREGFGLLLVGLGTLIVQLRRRRVAVVVDEIPASIGDPGGLSEK